MSIRKRYKSDGGYSWEFCITIQKHPRKQYRKSGFKTKTEAQQAEYEAVKKYKNKKIVLNPEKTTFGDIMELFFDHITISDEYEKGTISNYKGYYNNHLQYFEDLRLEEITPYIIQKWFDKATKSKSPHVINGCRKLCKAYISRQVGHARTSTTNDIYSSIMSDVNLNAKTEIENKIFCEHFVSL